jgi:broad specificity phosphatase PhoE
VSVVVPAADYASIEARSPRGRAPRKMTRMNRPVHLYLARHGETDLNVQMRYQGSTDMPLNELGWTQAQSLAQRLPPDITRIVASPLLRAQQTASLVSQARGLPILTMSEFRERDFGVFETLTHEETQARYPELYARKVVMQWDEAPPKAETIREVVARVQAGLQRLEAEHGGESVLLVAHGFVARAVRYLVKRWPETDFYLEPLMGNGEIHHYPELRWTAAV